MNRYSNIKLPCNNWIGLFQTYLNCKNIFILSWTFICSKLHPQKYFTICLFGFVLPCIQKHRCLFGFTFSTWDASPAAYVSIGILYLPYLNLRIGNGKTWKHFQFDSLN